MTSSGPPAHVLANRNPTLPSRARCTASQRERKSAHCTRACTLHARSSQPEQAWHAQKPRWRWCGLALPGARPGTGQGATATGSAPATAHAPVTARSGLHGPACFHQARAAASASAGRPGATAAPLATGRRCARKPTACARGRTEARGSAEQHAAQVTATARCLRAGAAASPVTVRLVACPRSLGVQAGQSQSVTEYLIPTSLLPSWIAAKVLSVSAIRIPTSFLILFHALVPVQKHGQSQPIKPCRPCSRRNQATRTLAPLDPCLRRACVCWCSW